MEDRYIYRLAVMFKEAIINARDAGLFYNDIVFHKFPRACCGDSCYLLAEFLISKGIQTIYVNGDFDGQSHAWLVIKDSRVKMPQKRLVEVPNEIGNVLNKYSGGKIDKTIKLQNYEEKDVKDGLIIDITADQFGEVPVYVDYMGEFHRQFDFSSAHDYIGLGTMRLEGLYKKIVNNM